GSVILSFLSAVGLGVLLFQVILKQELHWSVPGLAFVVLVAVGADYNMLLASRLRDESPFGVRSGVIRTVRSPGGVITAAGLIFAASMFGLLFSSIGAVVQSGFVLGAGILVDTFVVRTITVPAIAALLGRSSCWPARPWEQPPSDGPAKKTVFQGVAEGCAGGGGSIARTCAKAFSMAERMPGSTIASGSMPLTGSTPAGLVNGLSLCE